MWIGKSTSSTRPPYDLIKILQVQKSRMEQETLGRSRGGFGRKIHFRCEGTSRLMTFLLMSGQESDISIAEEQMEPGAFRRTSGRLRLRQALDGK